MKLLLDAGNTRIKWALVKEGAWEDSGVISVKRSVELKRLINKPESIEQIWASNVAGDRVQSEIIALDIPKTYFIQAQKKCCGVSNGYENPAQLGSDRWLALIAAWRLVGKACLVVTSGTATTIDNLSDHGEFRGGLILPGVETMINSLLENTCGLKTSIGAYQDFPRCTGDAILSGAIQATCGAIDRQRKILGNQVPVIISGGAANLLEKHLGMAAMKVENLVLRGLEQLSEEK